MCVWDVQLDMRGSAVYMPPPRTARPTCFQALTSPRGLQLHSARSDMLPGSPQPTPAPVVGPLSMLNYREFPAHTRSKFLSQACHGNGIFSPAVILSLN